MGKFSKVSLITILIGVLWSTYHFSPIKSPDKPIIQWDVVQYYYYLPAAFIYQDFDNQDTLFSKKLEERHFEYIDRSTGLTVNKMTVGQSYLFSPFFFLAHFYTKNFSSLPADGFSNPYEWGILLGAWISLIIGFVYLEKTLRNHLSDNIIALTFFLLFFGTNLPVFSIWKAGNTHVWTFAMVSALIFYSLSLKEKATLKNLIKVGVLITLITLIRPSNIILGILPLFQLLKFHKPLFKDLSFWVKQTLPVGLISFVIILPQLLYWKAQTGQYIFYSYGDEGFFWSDPKVFETLFSGRKGLFIFAPTLLFSFFGFRRMRRQIPDLILPLLLILILAIYITSAWWCWWYGGSYGLRPMIDYYPILAIFMGFGLKQLLSFKKKQFLVYIPMGLLVFHSLFLTNFFATNRLHHDALTIKNILMLYQGKQGSEEYKAALCHPNYWDAKLEGKRDLTNCL